MPDSISSVVGIGVLLFIAILLSTNRRAINWRIVVSAFGLQLGMAILVLYLPAGQAPEDLQWMGMQ